ncbi:heavy-metal-associated domain-containing protein [Robbsia sp. Bb-Pol-6]|uniref:Heavy-metal-associated domain-containing protein n=1 Tax=Robbsia betulipollinis TaxID=2981849 RepID=A0ABT3ZMY5_9BURK|nr:heavy-metal-associated domain-containing protein [Robbsia betulipollinis]MCY0387772.1 heavy-metal-associated domain-containing protein [Robbsia betulipollinis]
MSVFKVEGMSCQHCVQAVTQAVRRVDPAARVTIDLDAGTVHVAGSGSDAAVKAAIDDAGYTVAG